MRVQILVEINDHRRRYFAAEVCDLPEDQALRWIREAWAAAIGDEPEAATIDAGEEKAVLPRARRRG